MKAKIIAWLNRPYQSSMNLTGWFLMVGLILVAATLWAIILGHVHGGIEAITD